LAKETGVSLPTVHRAVLELVKEGYLKKESNRGYAVAREAVSTPHPQRNGSLPGPTIGCMIGSPAPERDDELPPDFQRAFFPIQNRCMREGYASLVMGVVLRTAGSITYPPLEEIASMGLAGLVTISLYDMGFLKDLSRVQKALVVADVDASDLGVDSVFFDNRRSAMEMVRILAQNGARRIAFIGGPYPPPNVPKRLRDSYDPSAGERYDGWRLGLHASGFVPSEDLAAFAENRSTEKTLQALRRLLDSDARPDAILSEQPLCVAEGLQQLGIPSGRIKVAGWTGGQSEIPEAPWANDLVAALCDFVELGRKSADLLAAALSEPRPTVRMVKLFPKIVRRKDRKVLVEG
jgi:DNA-binding LacI/PurR family transcriptional regulator